LESNSTTDKTNFLPVRYGVSTDEAGDRPRNLNRKAERARKRGCKSCGARVKGKCNHRRSKKKFPILTSAFDHDPTKVKCGNWHARHREAFELPDFHAPIHQEIGRNKVPVNRVRSCLKPTKPNRTQKNVPQAQQEK
jgi:hypothetical protein